MALLLLESFDALAEVSDKYSTDTANVTTSATQARTGTLSMLIDGTTSTFVYFPVLTATRTNEIYVGFAIYLTGYPGLDGYSAIRFIGDSIAGAFLVIQDDGELAVGGSTLQEYSGANKLSLNTWYYIEIKMIKSNSSSAGDVIVKVDGVEWINCDAGRDFLSGSYAWTDCVAFRGYAGADRYIDDLYICDETGAQNNTFLGQLKIATLYPSEDGNQNDFVGSDADSIDNFLLVDEATDDGDTTYVESDTPTEVDLYTMDNMPAASSSIVGVQVCSYMRTDAVGSRLARHVARVSTTDYEGADMGVNYAYMWGVTTWELNPGDSAAWEDADIDAVEFGIKVEA